MISTDNLMQRLFKTASIKNFIKRYSGEMVRIPFHAYVKKLCAERGTVPERIIKKSGIDRTYGHQIFNGRKNPSRDKVLQLAFGFGLNIDETQKLLSAARKSSLYPKIKRDAVVIFAISKGYSLEAVQATLEEMGLPALGLNLGNE